MFVMLAGTPAESFAYWVDPEFTMAFGVWEKEREDYAYDIGTDAPGKVEIMVLEKESMYPNLDASNNLEVAHIRVEPSALWETEGFIQRGNMDSYQGVVGTFLIEREVYQIELDPFKKLSAEADGTKTLVTESTQASTVQL